MVIPVLRQPLVCAKEPLVDGARTQSTEQLDEAGFVVWTDRAEPQRRAVGQLDPMDERPGVARHGTRRLDVIDDPRSVCTKDLPQREHGSASRIRTEDAWLIRSCESRFDEVRVGQSRLARPRRPGCHEGDRRCQHLGSVQNAAMAEAVSHQHLRAGPGLGNDLALLPWDLGVAAVVDHEQRGVECRRQGRDLERRPWPTNARFDTALHPLSHGARESQRFGEPRGGADQVRSGADVDGGGNCETLVEGSGCGHGPTEWATSPTSRPREAATSWIAAVISGIVTIPESDAPWPGASNVRTAKPRATSGPTKLPSCAPRPPQPCTRSTVGPAPQVHVSI